MTIISHLDTLFSIIAICFRFTIPLRLTQSPILWNPSIQFPVFTNSCHQLKFFYHTTGWFHSLRHLNLQAHKTKHSLRNHILLKCKQYVLLLLPHLCCTIDDLIVRASVHFIISYHVSLDPDLPADKVIWESGFGCGLGTFSFFEETESAG